MGKGPLTTRQRTATGGGDGGVGERHATGGSGWRGGNFMDVLKRRGETREWRDKGKEKVEK